ncbi:MAG: hypothetical protein ACTSYI_10535 [Promethearchaeota archaeon]
MTAEEIEERLLNIRKVAEATRGEKKRDGKEGFELLSKFREVLANDDGKEFWMVNLMKFKNSDPNSEAMAAHRRYSSNIAPMLLKRGSFPIFMSKVQGRFLYGDGSENWDQVAIIRYRSRQDFIKFATATAKKDIGDDKWQSMEKTQVFPVKALIKLGNIRLGIFLLLMVIILLMAVL